MFRTLCFFALVAATLAPQLSAAEALKKGAPEEKALRESMRKYEQAFNRGDAQRLATFWTENGEYVAPGKRLEGREALQAAYGALFAEGNQCRLQATTLRLRMVAPGVAVEEGTARLSCQGEPPAEAIFEAIHVKEDGQWKLSRVRETPIAPAPSNRDKLQPLAWMIGQWASSKEGVTVSTRCEWTASKSFLQRSFSVATGDGIAIEGTQIIGWDASTAQIRSWSFDSDGAFEEAVWRSDGGRWLVDATVVLPDGRKGSEERILTPVDGNAFTWRAVNRQVAGQLMPSIDELTIARAAGESPK
jgi:uncharacterized protein (TIGR02246 family)